MEFVFGGPGTDWHIRLKSGSVIVVWAGGYSEEADHVAFETAVRASAEEREDVDFTSGFFSDPEEVLIVTARIPSSEIDQICSGPFPSTSA